MWTALSFRLCSLNFCTLSLKQLLNMKAGMRSTCRVQEYSHVHEWSTCLPHYLLCTFDKSQMCLVLTWITQRYQLHPSSKIHCIKSVTRTLLFKNVTSKLQSCVLYMSILEKNNAMPIELFTWQVSIPFKYYRQGKIHICKFTVP
jgi:hypothetical protein